MPFSCDNGNGSVVKPATSALKEHDADAGAALATPQTTKRPRRNSDVQEALQEVAFRLDGKSSSTGSEDVHKHNGCLANSGAFCDGCLDVWERRHGAADSGQAACAEQAHVGWIRADDAQRMPGRFLRSQIQVCF